MNVFRKCLLDELGDEAYQHYIGLCEEELKRKTRVGHLEDQLVYKEMFRQLCVRSHAEIKKSGERLSSVMYEAFVIGRRFWFVTLYYIVANIVLLWLELDYTVTCISVILMGICFFYKLVEFLSNKYCFMDAYLIIVYRTILEKLAKRIPD